MGASRGSTSPVRSRGMTRPQGIEGQKAGLVTGAIDALADVGYEALTVTSVIKRACVSRKTFYEVFANRHECFEAVFEHISARAHAAVSAACGTQVGWLAATRPGLGALLSLIDEEPVLARIWFVESLAGHSAVLDQRARAMSCM